MDMAISPPVVWVVPSWPTLTIWERLQGGCPPRRHCPRPRTTYRHKWWGLWKRAYSRASEIIETLQFLSSFSKIIWKWNDSSRSCCSSSDCCSLSTTGVQGRQPVCVRKKVVKNVISLTCPLHWSWRWLSARTERPTQTWGTCRWRIMMLILSCHPPSSTRSWVNMRPTLGGSTFQCWNQRGAFIQRMSESIKPHSNVLLWSVWQCLCCR